MAKDTGEIMLAFENAKDGRVLFSKVFPAVFTMVCTLLFMVPCYLIVYAARDPVVKYFHGETYCVLVVIPVLILIVHGYHVRNKGPNRYVTHFALILPSVLLLIFGTSMLTSATSKADRLFSTDCNTMREKTHLQQQWEDARSLYRSCLTDTAAARNLTADYLAKNFRIQDCGEYEPSLRDHWRTWPYLQQLEENHACTGFCKPGEQLWSKGPHKDACAITVSSVFRYIVQKSSSQVVALSLMTLCLDMALVVFLGPSLSLASSMSKDSLPRSHATTGVA